MNKLQRLLQSKNLILTVCAAGIGGTFQYGYNISIINAPTFYIQTFMNKTWLERTGAPLESGMVLLLWSFTVSVFPLGGLAGAVAAGPMAIVLGRKMSLLVNNVFVIVAAVLSGFSQMAKSFEMIMLSRFLTGVNAGVSMNIQPMYLAESAPRKLRGAVALTSASFTALGLVLGQVVGLRELLGGEESWPLLLASNAVPALIQLMVLPCFPESPRYLLIDRGDRESCISALKKLRGSSDLGEELEEMLAEQAAAKGQRAKKPWELFRNPAVRWQLISIVVLSSAMQLCGNDSMYFYAAYVFQEAGIPQDTIPYVVIGTGSCELITSVTCNMIIDYAGRRPLLLGGYILMAGWATVFMVALSQQTQISWMPYLSMACIFAYILSFGIGPAGVTGVLPTEIFDQMSRPAAYMICGSLLWFNLFLVGTAFPFIVKNLAHFCYVPFLVVCICTALYIWFFLPETKGKSFLEISEEFRKRNFRAQSREAFYKGPEEIRSTTLLKKMSCNLFLLAFVLGIGGTFQYGLQISIMNSPAEYIKSFIHETWLKRYGSSPSEEIITLMWSFVVSIYTIGGLLGSMSVRYMSVKFGRKKSMLLANIPALLSATLMAFSRLSGSFEMIIIGRLFAGVCAGLGLNIHIMYAGECAPQKLRGVIAITASTAIAVGKFAGFALGLREVLGVEALWPVLMAANAIPALIQLLTLPFFPDSPRYLLIDKKDKEGCIKAVKQLWGDGDHMAEVDDMIAEQEAIRGEKSKSVCDLVRDKSVRWQFITLFLVSSCMQLIGVNVVYFYAYNVFLQVGLSPAQTRYVSLGVGITEILTTALCGFLVDRAGRKALLWKTHAAMALALGLLTVTLALQDSFSWTPYCSAALIFIFIMSFGLGPAGVLCPLPTEIFIQSYRPAAYAFNGATNWIQLFFLGLLFPFIVEGLGSFCFIIFLAYCLSMAIFVYLVVPETKGKSMLQIMEEFNRLNYGRKRGQAALQQNNCSLTTVTRL
ncbi:solute carrier family 2, facilitated glucose transporter member 11-like [Centrocercus urophasianus]|uniref:solute carrier family 2, facilitated glucose transporter member 11-like n=1 Tax=Centrocercus urophasianus TaxID=9002 RepID=UPI001C64C0F0|nr:solute carrier family 2, facilitated glucose transporter member 11-like [Centrocercus urophasianus]